MSKEEAKTAQSTAPSSAHSSQ
jgi:hypothetical protein